MPPPDDIAAESGEQLSDGIALCLSGGGYRAMLFHTGALIRLNQFRLLPRIRRVSSVSGGSITAAVLGLNWTKLDFQAGTSNAGIAANLDQLLVQPIRSLASTTIDRRAILAGIFLPGSISDRVISAYNNVLFHGATLNDLPTDTHGPRFVINATSVQTGALVRFSRPYVADYLVGKISNPRIPLAQAVAASSAFPPVLSPTVIHVDPNDFERQTPGPLQHQPFTSRFVLTDGGVYDNLGLETAWKRFKTLLVSDGGGKMAPEPEPPKDWARHSKRVLEIIDNQVRSLRKRQLIEAFRNRSDEHDGTYWGIRTNIQDYQLSDAIDCPHLATQALADTPTRLKALSDSVQDRIMNWGYAVCDAAIRKHMAHLATEPCAPHFPFDGGVG